ncbi:MAG: class I SAM-dependent methyltransferase, partial [Patescibacteria group bacterium]
YLTKYKKKKIVDFGSGGGRLTIPLLQNGYEVLAIDIDKKSREQLLKTAIKIGKNKNLQISKKFPKDKKYDHILGTDILHHINIDKYFKLFNNHLKKDGKIIFSEPNILNIGWAFFISLFLDWNIEKGIVQINYFNLVKELKLAGFKNIKIIGLFLFPPMIFNWFSLLRRINMFLGNLPILKLFAFRYIITANK